MDPFSITTGVAGLLGVVGQTIIAVTNFIRTCREARSDLTAINRELSELQIVLELLRDDSAINANNVFPEALRAQVLSIITNCNTTIKQINIVLEKHYVSQFMVVKWATAGKMEVSSLKMSLEAHRGSLNLALEMINISISKSTKEDTTVIRSDVARIKRNTHRMAQILEELAILRDISSDARREWSRTGDGDSDSDSSLEELESVQTFSDTDTSSEDDTLSTDSLSSQLSRSTAKASSTKRFLSKFAINKTRKLICIGDHLVGKSTLLLKWSTGLFSEDPVTGQGAEEYSNNSKIDDKYVQFTVWDTPGDVAYDDIQCRVPIQAVLICFSIVSPDSFDNVEDEWIEEAHSYGRKIPCILVGLQMDLRFDPKTLNDLEIIGQKPVSREEGEEMREQLGAAAYIECSAKTSEGIHEVFYAAERAIKSRRKARWFPFVW